MTNLWFYRGYTFEFIKAVSDTVLDMINAAYHDKPLILIRATFREKLVSYHRAVMKQILSYLSEM